ncbi:MAG: hypothetical protein NT036_03750, partial [Candidatus Omnitrophica bacterium]|nr:hypothetical protein [Candidatus Omnitrophota bacterium]
ALSDKEGFSGLDYAAFREEILGIPSLAKHRNMVKEEPIFDAKRWNWKKVLEAVPDYYDAKRENHLTSDQEYALGREKDDGNGAAWQALVYLNKGLIYQMFINLKNKNKISMSEDEAVSEGYMALMRAAAGFDWRRKRRFSTYACNAIINTITRLDKKASRQQRGRISSDDRGNESLMDWLKNQDIPAKHKGAGSMDLSSLLDSILSRTDDVSIDLLARLNALFSFDDGFKSLVREWIKGAGFDDSYKTIIMRRLNGDTLEETRRKTGLSNEEVRQKQNKIIKAMNDSDFLSDLQIFCSEKSAGIKVESMEDLPDGSVRFGLLKDGRSFEITVGAQKKLSRPRSAAAKSPAGSIAGALEHLAKTDANSAKTGKQIAQELGLAYASIDTDLRALYYHLHLIEKIDKQETGKDARYYVPERVKKKLNDKETRS